MAVVISLTLGAAMQFVNCPYCGNQVPNDGTLVGRSVACPACRRQFTMPIDGPVPPPVVLPVGKPVLQGDSSSFYEEFMPGELGHMFRKALRQRRGADLWKILVYLVDPMFKRYLTPWIIRWTWCLALLAAFIWISVLGYAHLYDIVAPERLSRFKVESPAAEGPMEHRAPDDPSEWWKAVERVPRSLGIYTVQIIASVIGILWIRVVLEGAIVLFNIVSKLGAIDEHLVAMNRSPRKD